MNVERLKEQARTHELREEWRKAFDLYKAALRNQDEEEPPDITLYNRVGDIQTRLGEIAGAVEHYEKAIELYLEAELPNNAIAICKKVLRNLPNKTIFFLRMGQIRASQGFLSDARHNFLTYAEKQTAAGNIQDALDALVEFVEISPEDVEIRLALAGQLETQERVEEAIEQYVVAYRKLALDDREDEALAVAEKLGELAPDLELDSPEAIREAEADAKTSADEEFVVESTSLGGLEFASWEDEPAEADEEETPAPEAPAVEPGEEGEAPEDWPEGGIAAEPVAGEEALEPSFAVDAAPAGDLSEPQALVQGEEESEGLPEFDFQGDTYATGEEIEVEEESPDSEAEELPSFDFEVEGFAVGMVEGDEAIPEEDDLPFMDLDDADLGEEAEDADEEPLPTLGDDGTPDLPYLSLDLEERGTAPPVETHEEAAERGDLQRAMELVSALIESEPDEVTHHQRLVEYAFRVSDDSALIPAYLGLASCLARTGSPVKARAVYQQVLALAPGQPDAEAGLQTLAGAAAPPPPPRVASSEEYVDLGSMILGDEPEKTTRWRVQADAPTGDDEADFARMLGQFKEKVSEHVAADDVSAHHDLGTAYMEMGLLDEAIGEFQMALRASPGHLATHEVMGRCWLELGKADMAIRALRRALNVPYDVEDELIGIYYLIGRASEQVGNTSEAVEFYEKVFSLDINFQDVTERLRALR